MLADKETLLSEKFSIVLMEIFFPPVRQQQETSWPQVALLQEMFPGASPAEVRHCLAVAEGDVAKAAQLVLHRQEAGQSITSNMTFLTVGRISMESSENK